MEVNEGIYGGRDIIRCSSVTQKHICLNQVHNRLTYTHRCMGNMTSTNTVFSWRNEKGKCILETQAGRLRGLGCCTADQRGSRENDSHCMSCYMSIRPYCSALY